MNPNPQTLCGVVVSAGKMMRAVKVRTAKQVFNNYLKKNYLVHKNHLVSDPNSSLRTGDVVKITNEKRVSRHIKHVVTEIVAPWGPGIEERPRIMSREERFEKWRVWKEGKEKRRRERREAVERGKVGAKVEGGEGKRKVEAMTAR
ncbi:hypothetical protein N7G274_002040 [Stereocaulon virgatum]|uniref:Ribosomal protein S17 n=1 Tax=Stereocaulon virgatum TaxID=373712 RepID=A0ABR4AIL3_9LECA